MNKTIGTFKSEMKANFQRWIQNTKKHKMSSKAAEIVPKPPLTPFRRNRSRAFYASEDNLLQDEDDDCGNNFTIFSSASTGTLKISVPASSSSSEDFFVVNKSQSPVTSEIREVKEDEKPPVAEEATNSSSEDYQSPICSPPASWRGSDRSSSTDSWRGSPSQRSQDSGYSDSGESASGSPNEERLSEPQVKHITRVYFGDYKKQELVNEQTQTTATPRTYRVGKRRAHSNCCSRFSVLSKHLSKSEPRLASKVLLSPKRSNPSPTINSSNKYETMCQLEHKSLSSVQLRCSEINPANSLPIKTPSPRCSSSDNSIESIDPGTVSLLKTLPKSGSECQKSGKYTSRLYRKFSYAKKFTSKSSSSEKLCITDDKSRRRDPIKAKRRWSSADLGRCLPTLNLSKGKLNLSSTTIHEDLEYQPPVANIKTPLEIAKYLGNDSLCYWLQDLELVTDSECMNTLQSKSLYSESAYPVAATTQAHLTNIQKKAHLVSAEFALLCKRLENLQLYLVPTLVDSLVSSVRVFVKNSQENQIQKRSLQCQIKVVDQICTSLTEICSKSLPKNDTPVKTKSMHKKIDKDQIRDLVQIVTALGHAFTKLVDLLLSDGIQTIVHLLEDISNEREVESAVTEITALGVHGGHVCKLVSRVGGIRALLGVCQESKLCRLRAQSLRALATVCCVAEGIDKFEEEGGVKVIAEVLCDSECSENERAEAAGVLAQITSPWVDDTQNLPGLHKHLKSLISSLTELATSTTSAEVFLLTSAALANLTFLDVSCIESLLESSTHLMLLKRARTDESLSVFTKDQIATILANMSSSPIAAQHLIDSEGIEVLLQLLQTSPHATRRSSEAAAIERVQQKSAIAISRLSTKEEAALVVLNKGGASRLVYLCKNERERNHSDAVLVACLAALRKIASSCGSEGLKHVNASELIEPKLLDSFLIYSSQNESFV